MKFVIPIMLALSIPVQQPVALPQNTVLQSTFTLAEHIGDEQRSFFLFTAGGLSYSIRNDGFAESGSNKVLRRNFRITTGKGKLVRVLFAEHQGDLLLLDEVSDGDFGWGYLVRFNQKERVAKWIEPVNSFNLTNALIDGNEVYLSGANFIAKVDLHRGKYVWKHEELAKQGNVADFLSFRLPQIESDRVLFTENGDEGRRIEVDKATGKILKISERGRPLN